MKSLPRLSGRSCLMRWSGALALLLASAATAQPAPRNDSCSSCEPLTGTGLFRFDTSSATTGNDGQDNVQCDFEGSRRITQDVWFCWRSKCTGPVVIDTCDLTALDTRLAVYAGPRCAQTILDCDDDECGLQSKVRFTATAGDLYYIQLGHYEDSRPGAGQFRITCEPPALVACCLRDGSCVNLAPQDCERRGGEPGAPGTQCPDPLAGLIDPAAQNEVIVPRAWQPKVTNWTGDADGNSVEDLIDAMPPTDILDIILCLNEAPRKGDLNRFAALGTIGYVSRYLPVVQLTNITAANAQALALDVRVALVQLNHVGVYTSDTSVAGIRVRSSASYSPNTVEDTYPAITGTGINIAVLDSAVDNMGGPGVTHTSLPVPVGAYTGIGQTETDSNDFNGHGTHVAGIALGRLNGAYRGVAPDAGLIDMLVGNVAPVEIAVIRALDKCIERRVDWSIRVATLAMDLGASDNGLSASAQAVNRVVQAGIVVTCATANSGPLVEVPPPASADYAITVASAFDNATADRTDDTISSFSSRGPRPDDADLDLTEEFKPDVTAHGESIMSCDNDSVSGYVLNSGASMAAPHVAGLTALIIQANPSMLPLSVKQHIINTAEDRGAPGWDLEWGHGLVNGFAAINDIFGGTTTDLRFDCYMGAPSGDCIGNPWWFSPDVKPVNPIIDEGVPNSIEARVYNAGPNPAVNFLVKIGVYNFSNSMADYHVATVLVPGPLPVGATQTVTVPWTPTVTGGPIGTVHACIKGEIIFTQDTLYSNNQAQHNINIQNTFSPARFQMQVVNPTNQDLLMTLAHNFDECQGNGNWTVLLPEPFTMRAGDPPRTVLILVDPVETRQGSAIIGIEVVGRNDNGERFTLGGVGLVAQTRNIPDCNANGTDDDVEIRLQLTRDRNRNGVPDDCESIHCPCDFDLDNRIDSADFFAFLAAFFSFDDAADYDSNGQVSSADFFDFLACFFQSPPRMPLTRLPI